MASIFNQFRYLRPMAAMTPFLGNREPGNAGHYKPEELISNANTRIGNLDFSSRKVTSGAINAAGRGVQDDCFSCHFSPKVLLCDEREELRGTLPELNPNPKMKHLSSLGLQKVENGWYQLNDKNPIHIRLEGGQMVWKVMGEMEEAHVQEVADFYRKKLPNRSIHINTALKNRSLSSEDVIPFKGTSYISYLNFSPKKTPVLHADRPNIDIINAWSFSGRSAYYFGIDDPDEWEKVALEIADESKLSLWNVLKPFVDDENVTRSKNISLRANCAKKIAEYTEKNLRQVQYASLMGPDIYFFKGLAKTSGCKLDPVLIRHFSGRKTGVLVHHIPDYKKTHRYAGDKIRAKIQEQNLYNLRMLNNIYVLTPENDRDFKRVETKLGQFVTRMKNESFFRFRLPWIFETVFERGRRFTQDVLTVQENLQMGKDEKDKLILFPQIEFHQIPDEKRKAAEEWLEKHPLPNREKSVDLSHTNLESGLRVLIDDLMVEKEIEDIDLSDNTFGSEGMNAVAELLKYPGSMKTLRFNNNALQENPDQFDTFLEGLKRNVSLEKLFLNNNGLDEKEIKKLCSALENHPNIKVVQLINNPIGDGLLSLMDLAENHRSLREIWTHSMVRITNSDNFP